MHDLTSEQTALKTTENKVRSLSRSVAALAAIAVTVDQATGKTVASDALSDVNTQLVDLAATLDKAHAAIEGEAIRVGAQFVHGEKQPPQQVLEFVKSSLGI